MEELVPRQLFGGAMSISIPSRFADISDFRPIPDHQEVWADGSADQSLIVEIVEHQADIPDDHCGAFFLEDVAKNNHATYAGIETIRRMTSADVPLLPPSTFCCLAVGDQAVSKGQQGVQAVNKVQILLCIVRLPAQGSDVLLTLNTPIFISEHSAAAQNAGAGYKDISVTSPQLFQEMLRSFQIIDWSLFGGQ